MEPLKPQWLKNLARDNLKREIEMYNRQHKSNPRDHDKCLWLLHNEEYKQNTRTQISTKIISAIRLSI